MLNKLLLPVAMLAALSFSTVASAADPACKEDKDCKAGTVCVLALNPPACKAPQAAGAPCKRDAVCASGKCDTAASVCK